MNFQNNLCGNNLAKIIDAVGDHLDIMTIDTTNESYFSKRKNIGEIRKFWLA
jgi:hypothetical protein